MDLEEKDVRILQIIAEWDSKKGWRSLLETIGLTKKELLTFAQEEECHEDAFREVVDSIEEEETYGLHLSRLSSTSGDLDSEKLDLYETVFAKSNLFIAHATPHLKGNALIGVQGKRGSGKTSFLNLLRRYFILKISYTGLGRPYYIKCSELPEFRNYADAEGYIKQMCSISEFNGKTFFLDDFDVCSRTFHEYFVNHVADGKKDTCVVVSGTSLTNPSGYDYLFEMPTLSNDSLIGILASENIAENDANEFVTSLDFDNENTSYTRVAGFLRMYARTFSYINQSLAVPVFSNFVEIFLNTLRGAFDSESEYTEFYTSIFYSRTSNSPNLVYYLADKTRDKLDRLGVLVEFKGGEISFANDLIPDMIATEFLNKHLMKISIGKESYRYKYINDIAKYRDRNAAANSDA